MKSFKISVFESLGNQLSSREQADLLYKAIKQYAEKVILDFREVDFMSRSFADQFYKEFLRLNKEMLITVVNSNQSISDTINAVSRTQYGAKRDRISFKMQSFVDKDKLKRYLESID